jgi:hypothetical protein
MGFEMETKTLVRRLNSIIEITKTPTSVSYTEIARFMNGSWYIITKNAKEFDVCDRETSRKYAMIENDDWCFTEKCRACPIFMMSTNRSEDDI